MIKKKYNIVVWGGSGFIGSHVSDFLSKEGHKITITAGKISLMKVCFFCSNIFCVSIVNPIEPKIIIPSEANNSSLTNAELT